MHGRNNAKEVRSRTKQTKWIYTRQQKSSQFGQTDGDPRQYPFEDRRPNQTKTNPTVRAIWW